MNVTELKAQFTLPGHDDHELYEITRYVNDTYFPTSQFIGFALGERETSREIVAGTKIARPIWEAGNIATDEESARRYLEEILADDPEYTRVMIASALVEAGWTFSAFCRRLS